MVRHLEQRLKRCDRDRRRLLAALREDVNACERVRGRVDAVRRNDGDGDIDEALDVVVVVEREDAGRKVEAEVLRKYRVAVDDLEGELLVALDAIWQRIRG